EEFDVNPPRRHAHAEKRLFHVCHEAGGAAEVEIRLPWDADVVQDRSRQVTGTVEILAYPVARVRPAVTNIAAAMRERRHKAADFGGEWMMLPLTRRVQPPDLPCRADRRQRVKHRQNGR